MTQLSKRNIVGFCPRRNKVSSVDFSQILHCYAAISRISTSGVDLRAHCASWPDFRLSISERPYSLALVRSTHFHRFAWFNQRWLGHLQHLQYASHTYRVWWTSFLRFSAIKRIQNYFSIIRRLRFFCSDLIVKPLWLSARTRIARGCNLHSTPIHPHRCRLDSLLGAFTSVPWTSWYFYCGSWWFLVL